MTTYNITTAPRPKMRSRNPLLFWLIMTPTALFALMIAACIFAGTVKAIAGSHSSNQIVIERTDSMYQDCTAFASARGFALDVCESLNPKSAIAKINCKAEVTQGLDPVDCALKP